MSISKVGPRRTQKKIQKRIDMLGPKAIELIQWVREGLRTRRSAYIFDEHGKGWPDDWRLRGEAGAIFELWPDLTTGEQNVLTALLRGGLPGTVWGVEAAERFLILAFPERYGEMLQLVEEAITEELQRNPEYKISNNEPGMGRKYRLEDRYVKRVPLDEGNIEGYEVDPEKHYFRRELGSEILESAVQIAKMGKMTYRDWTFFMERYGLRYGAGYGIEKEYDLIAWGAGLSKTAIGQQVKRVEKALTDSEVVRERLGIFTDLEGDEPTEPAGLWKEVGKAKSQALDSDVLERFKLSGTPSDPPEVQRELKGTPIKEPEMKDAILDEGPSVVKFPVRFADGVIAPEADPIDPEQFKIPPYADLSGGEMTKAHFKTRLLGVVHPFRHILRRGKPPPHRLRRRFPSPVSKRMNYPSHGFKMSFKRFFQQWAESVGDSFWRRTLSSAIEYAYLPLWQRGGTVVRSGPIGPDGQRLGEHADTSAWDELSIAPGLAASIGASEYLGSLSFSLRTPVFVRTPIPVW